MGVIGYKISRDETEIITCHKSDKTGENYKAKTRGKIVKFNTFDDVFVLHLDRTGQWVVSHKDTGFFLSTSSVGESAVIYAATMLEQIPREKFNEKIERAKNIFQNTTKFIRNHYPKKK